MKRTRRLPAVLVALAASLLPVASAAAGQQANGPALVVQAPERGIPDQYIVLVKPGAEPRSVAAVAGVNPRHVYTAALNGFAAALNQGQLTALQHNRNVDYIEQDAEVHGASSQASPTWGLDRIDQRNLPLSQSFSYAASGSGVKAYIIDTGIRFSHTEFGARATSGVDAVDGGSADDCNGHGTHVAGTVGGTTFGVAKEVTLVAVRVLDCSGSGTWSGVIAGIDWVTRDHEVGQSAVANLSLGGGASTAVDSAVRNMIVDGVATAVAAGNGNNGGVAQDACKYSPARVAEAMTIGATDQSDFKTSWSNYGSCVDWFAPGRSITSAWYTGDTATNTISGTSMATPHTAGVAALYLQNNPGATAQAVRDALYAATTRGVVKSSKTTNNHLLFTSY